MGSNHSWLRNICAADASIPLLRGLFWRFGLLEGCFGGFLGELC